MRIRFGYELSYDFPGPTPMIVMLSVHHSRVSDLECPDWLVTNPAVPIQNYRDSFGNWCNRLVGLPGQFTLSTDSIIRDDGDVDATNENAVQCPVEQLPSETMIFLLGSRYCETDCLSEEAWRLFGATQAGWPRVQVICNFVNQHIKFGYEYSRSTKTAAEAYREGHGVCRDYAHLAITFCRCMNIPARYCTGYLSDIGQPPPFGTMDFAAWIEVYLDGSWWVFDPRNNSSQRGRILIAYGRDAADVPLTHTFGPNTLTGFRVWVEEIESSLTVSDLNKVN